MEKLVVVLLLVTAFQAHSASFPIIHNYLLRIDCGVISKTTERYNNQTWFPDNYFIDPGKTKQISSTTTKNNLAINVSEVMTTLRYFPGGANESSCYKLPLINTQKFIFRAGFYYGNYDGKAQPPVFDLRLGGHFWATIDSSASYEGPAFEEVIYGPRNDNISVCVVGKKDGGAPFISSLEAIYLDKSLSENHALYGVMRNGTAYHLVSRINFGGYDQVIEPWSGWLHPCEERLNRYWTPQPMPGYTNLSFDANTCIGQGYENAPPNSLLKTAVSPSSASQSIIVPINFPSTTPQSAYIVLYFYQNLNVNGSTTLNATRNMDIYVNGVMINNVKLEKSRSGEVVTMYPVLVQGGRANVTISPGNGTILPPLLNGMEVFVGTELVEQATSDGFKVSSSFIVVCVFHLFVSVFLVRA